MSFSSPSDADLPNLTNAESQTLWRLLKKRIDPSQKAKARSIPKRDPLEPLPLSFAQKRLWFLAQLDERAGAAYSMPGGVRLRGELDAPALHAALDRIVTRHEALRTCFPSVEGSPVQLIAAPDAGFTLAQTDLWGHVAPDAELERLAAKEVSTPFDLARGPLIRGRLVRLADDDHALLLTMHHIVSDGWSLGLLINELSALYMAFSRGQPDPLPALAIQYADYALWQHRWIASDVLQRQFDFWRDQLSGSPALLELPTDRPRPAVQDYSGASLNFELDEALSGGLKALSRRHGTTLFMTLLASWAAVLSRLSGQDEVVIGTPVANRTHTELEPLIGFFVNTLALRIDLSGQPSVAELLAQVRATALAAQDHQDLPFEQVVEALNPPRSLAHSPVFQVLFAWQNAPDGTLELPGLQLTPVSSESTTIKFDLEVSMHEADERIAGSIGYANALFDEASIERHLARWQTLLRAMAANDAAQVSRLPLLSVPERQQLVHGFNATGTVFPAERCIHELFEEQVARTPEAIAVVCENSTLSYAELNARANRLAHHLRSLGVGPDARVAICVERGMLMVIGLLAILKAGGAYVPLDPDYPADRLAFMLEDSTPLVLLTNAGVRAGLDALPASLTVFEFDSPSSNWDNSLPATNLEPSSLGLTSSHLAYVIYTSGSTGTPKGVMVEHAGLCNLALAQIAGFGVTPDSRVLQFASFSFDACISEVLMALCSGAALHVPAPGVLAGEALLQMLQEQRISHATLPPAVLAGLPEQALGTLQTLVMAGEAASGALVQRWARGRRLLNAYGPTEATVCASMQTCDAQHPGNPPIGRPIANTRIYILDAHGAPVPAGVAGEIHIGGAGVARGYLNRPELTVERFVSDPFAGKPNARMYKTGDLGRWLIDHNGGGTIEFLGRNDHQIKVRGFRIEPGEIEAALLQHPEVREAVVLAREDAPGDRRLVAYMVGENALAPEVLHAHLSARLPEYMVPAAYVQLDALPLTPNGKLDRRALPAPDGDAFGTRGYEPPQGELEATLAAIWSELLGVERIGRHDKFFQLGGHSLLAVALIERMRRLGWQLEVRSLFTSPTLADLAATVQASSHVPVPANLIGPECHRITPELLPLVELSQQEIETIVATVPGGAANVQDIYPLAPLQEGILFHHLLTPDGDTYLLPTLLSFDSRERLDNFLAALQSVIDRHDILRTAIAWQGLKEPVQVVWRHAPLAVQDFAPADGDVAAQLVAHFDARHTRIDLRCAPLLRAHVARDPQHGRWLLCLLQHHVVSDHTTLELIVEEVQAHLAGQIHRLLTPLPFRNFVAQACLGASRTQHEAFFTSMLADVDEPTAPFGLLDVQGAGARNEARLPIEPELAQRLRVQARHGGVSTASLFHLAWALVLARTTGRDDVVFGTVLFGRMQGGDGAHRVLGMFMNTLPIRLALGTSSVEQAVRETHARLAQLLQHEHAPLPLAQRCSGIAAPTPLFSTLLNYRYQGGSETMEVDPAQARQAWDGIELLHNQERTNYPLDVSVNDTGDALSLDVQTDPSLDAERIGRYLLRALEQLARTLEQAPLMPACALEVLPPDERHQVVYGWNAAKSPSCPHLCIHELVEAQVRRTPHLASVHCEGVTLTYTELNSRANQLAHHLRALGVKPDARVALCVPRGVTMVLGLLAILKAGGAYVPLDPDYPVERLAYMLEDSAPVVLLTDASTAARLRVPSQMLTCQLDAPEAPWINQPEHDLPTGALMPSHVAYVIYTSGSTGTPKGVMVEHRSLVHYTLGAAELFGIRASDCVLQQNSANFDLSIEEMMPALISGAALHISRAPLLATGLSPDHRPTVLHLTAAHWHALVGDWQRAPEQARAQLHGVRLINVTGDALSPQKLRHWSALGLSTQLINTYGPTETTVSCTAAHLLAEVDAKAAVTIGAPLPGVRMYVLDTRLQPAPIGVAGRLYVGGVQVGRGYHLRPALTAERFVPDPYAAEAGHSGARMYDTGDLGRWLADGTIEFLGRNDHQVKIRGFRVELGEIESSLQACTGVREAAVLAREDNARDKRLVAYYTGDAAVPSAQLREQLAQRLPEYMVPTAYVQLDSLPLTPGGKLDRRALPAPGDSALDHRTWEPPQNELETTLSLLWSEVLGVERVGRHDHFFELGGHSLLALQLASRIRMRLGVEVPLAELFAQPTLASFAERVGAATASTLPAIVPASRSEPLPLSFAQQRLWFLARLDERASAAYLIPGGVRLLGALDVAALRAALDRIVARHEALRTRFVILDGAAVQVIAEPDVGFALEVVDVAGHADSEAELERLAAEEATAPFDLERGPLIRGRLVHLAEHDHALLVTMHHIISDAWSMGVLINEFSALYTAYSQGRTDPLPALSIQYADYAAWQRRWVAGDVLQRQLDFWRAHLRGAPALLELPTDRPRPAAQDYIGSAVGFELDEALTADLKALGRRHGTTLFMTLLASWAMLLARLSGQDQVVIGTPVANRTRAEVEPLIGFFVNTQALRIDLSGSPTVAQLLAQVRATALAAQDHQDVPFEQVVEALNPPRSLAHAPVFQVIFAWQNAPEGTLDLPGLQLHPAGAGSNTIKFDFDVSMQEAGERIAGVLGYACALFDRATVERYLGHWLALMRVMAADEAAPVARLPLLSKQERDLLLHDWKVTAAPLPSDRCIHSLFEEQAARTPGAIAVVFEDITLSYSELNAQANRLAHHLIALGVRPDARVALALPRGPDLVVAVLATLKAAGAYVPLDPHYPADRLAFMLTDSAPHVLVTHTRVRQALGAQPASIPVLTVDLPVWGGLPSTNPDPTALGLMPDHLAYVIYTSGSTGTPKGVMVEHAQLARLFPATRTWFDFGPDDVWTLFHSYAFDFSVWELWGALLHGGRLVVVPQLTARSTSEFYALLCDQGVTVLNQTPSAFRQLIAAQAESDRVHRLRCVIFGGEALEPALLTPWYARNGDRTQLVNMYGITETTVHVTCRPLSPQDTLGSASPIGEPIADLRVVLLDANGQPVPIGVVGELYVGGAGVARGYLNRPQLTAERFVPDPFAAEAGMAHARMYKTGDLGRRRPDGTLEFLGRNDQQVKIRGFRIELGEIEARLLQHPDVRDAVVLAREDEPGGKRLVAYVIGEHTQPDALRAHLVAQLPEHMVPAAYVQLDVLPLTPHGKLDRRALPAPEGSAYDTRAYEAPQGDVETALAAIWSELLDVERISRHDDFFALGGHSLLAVRLIERMRSAGWRLEVRSLFTSSSLAALAATVDSDTAVPVPPNLIAPGCSRITPQLLPLVQLTQESIDAIVGTVPGGAANVQDIYPLAPLQEGILFHHLAASAGDAYLQPLVLSFDSRERLGRFVAALQCVVDRHDILRTAFVWQGLPEPVQVVCRRAALPIEELALDGDDVLAQLIARFDPRHMRIDVRQAPLLRGHATHDAGQGRWLLCLLQHHLVGDHTTLELLIEEVQAHLAGQAHQLPPPLPFRNFIAQSRLGLSSAQHEAYFRQMLGDIAEPTAPYGLLNVHSDGSNVHEAHLPLDHDLARQLRAHARRLGVSSASLFHLAWALVLARTTGRRDVVFGTVLFGRLHGSQGVHRVLGMFLNTLPIRLTLDGLDVEAAVRATHARLAQLLHHEHAPLSMAQRCSAVPAPAPLFTSLLNYRYAGGSNLLTHDEAQAEQAWHGVHLLHDHERSNYPLGLTVDDAGEAYSLLVQADRPIDAHQVAGFVQHALQALADALQHARDSAVCTLDVLPAAERHQLLHGWNATEPSFLSDRCVHQLFEDQAARTPQAAAVVSASTTLSYAELNARANRLAHRLMALGVRPGAHVAIALPRCADMIVALLATLKAGGAYVPLDPDYPAERLAFMLDDCRPRVVLTLAAVQDQLPASRALLTATVIELDDPQPWQHLPTTNPDPSSLGLSSSHLAYVIYTSGSTGKPKGVMVQHAGLCNLALAQIAGFGVVPDSRVLQFASSSFDACISEVLMALCSGAALHVPAPGALAGQALLDVLHKQRITHATLPPAVLTALPEQAALPADLHTLVVAGEAATPALVSSWGAGRRLLNAYGPTEATVCASMQLCDARHPGQPPIGRPITNTRIYILDAHGLPTPRNVAGEIHIGGVGVALGYLKRPDLTAERFVADPFAAAPGSRMYKTGDLGRWIIDDTGNGTIEFIGRNDHQVKIRGYRIEPGEIEAKLREHAGVREAVVLAREDSPGDKRLVAYVVGEDLQTDVLRQHLGAHLPEYMVPAAYVQLDALPLTPNGKLDRRSLPAPEDEAYGTRTHEAPQGELESTLASIWAELLGVDRVGRRDHFFELGGHSLLAVQLTSRIRARLGCEVPLAELFAQPTLAGFAQRVAAATASTLPAIVPASREGALPLSFAQQRLWFLARLDERAGTAYLIPGGVRLLGALDVAALRAALDRIVVRHEALRTRFAMLDGAAVQVIAESDVGIALQQVDLTGHAEPETELARLAEEEFSAPFDLERDPLIRGRLVRMAEHDHALLITMHHIVSDGWSMGVLINEFAALYAACAQGRPDPLPALAIQYADYAVWQRRWISGDVLQRQLDFWRTHLDGAPALLELPTDRPRPAVQDYAGASLGFELDAELSADLKALSRRHGTTLFMTLLAAWAALLSRLSRQAEVVIGTPMANRTRTELEPLIGFFVNTLALRIDLSGSPSVAELLAQVRATTLAAQDHQDLPFEQVVEALNPPRSLAHSPVFQVMFAWQNAPEGNLEMAGLELQPVGTSSTTIKFDLEVSLQEAGERIAGSIGYATALFEASTIERHLGHWQTLLRALVADDQAVVARLPLLSDDERHWLLHRFNATAAPFPAERCIHELFEAQAERTPTAAAVMFEDTAISYAELNTQANRLAHRLIRLGVRPGDRVALALARSSDLVAAELAALKCGAAYVPLDLDHPLERLRYLLADSQARILMCRSDLGWNLPEVRQLKLDALDSGDSPANPGLALHAENAAYVMYTSGSTGSPKGVVVPHRAVVNFALNRGHALLQSSDRVAFLANAAFDASTFEVWAPLLHGAAIVVVDQPTLLEPHALARRLLNAQVTVAHLTAGLLPGHAHALEAMLPRLRYLLTGGDRVDVAAVARILANAAPQRLLHCYGPTETTTFAITHEVKALAAEARSVPLGRPIANARVYILDMHGQPVPHGVAGEIHINGAGVAHGYLNRPNLTAERFVPDPFGPPGSRMYKTGDLGRWLIGDHGDGTIEFLGRNDHQVKIRGFRIELGEIEAKLLEHPGVREAVVLAREDSPGGKRLVAYVVGDNSLQPEALRAHLAAQLPEYMVPAAFVELPALPLTPNGKLDRRALPAPEDEAYGTRTHEVPQGELESTLAAIWAELLGVERVSRRDHFFELGGHSLLAVQLTSRIRARLGCEVPLAELFAQPTLAGFAQRVAAATASTLPAIVPASREGALPLSFAQQRLWFLARLDERAGAAYLIPGGVRLLGALDVAALRAALDRIVARHEALRTRFAMLDGAAVQVIAESDVGIALQQVDLTGHAEPETELARLAEEEFSAPFDLERDPLIRGRLVRMAEHDHALLITMHHIVSDGWSMGVLINEFAALYAACAQGRPDPLPALAIQYADYAVWQRRWISGDVLQRQLDFWRTHLDGAPALLELPTDRPRPAVQDHAGASLGFELDAELSADLKALSRRHGTTLFMTLLAAWAALLSRLSGQAEVVIGSPVANRTRTEVEPLIGFFINPLALRIDLSGSPSVAELLAQVRSTTLAAQAHQDLPFEQVVEALRPARSLAHSPLFQAWFDWQNASKDDLQLPGITLQAIGTPQHTTQFDLMLSMQEAGELMGGSLGYASALFDAGTIERFLGHWQTLLRAMVANDTQPVHALALLSAQQRHQLVHGWNATDRDFPAERCIHELFEEQVESTPEATALVFEDTALSYAELNAQANQLAHRLIAGGVRPDTRVAIALPRSPAMVVALLATLKAGGAYVPLDPDYPAERLAFMLDDCRPRVVLTHVAVQERLPASRALLTATVLELDSPSRDWDHLPATNPEPASLGLSSSHLAYVIYTSGSTGRPKGVMVEHSGLVNYVHWAMSAYAPGGGSVVSSSLSFDATVTSLYAPLLCGGTVTLLPEHQEIEALEALLTRSRQAGLVKITPAHLELLGQQLRAKGLPCRAEVFVIGGEALSPSTVQLWREQAPALRLVNEYGPTETVVGCVVHEASQDGPVAARVPIGRPIANTRIYILDAHGQPVPVGVAGEIHIGGAGVARGYLNRPELTAERFVRDSFAAEAGIEARMYKTGDLGRWRIDHNGDGTIEFLGRNDHQVKIRGFRIELGEIEARLLEHPSVREAVVLAREDAPGDRRLVAYITGEDTVPPEALRAHLGDCLPEYMVPAAYVRLEALPLTPNGKLDRHALPAPDAEACASGTYEAPQGAVEEAVADAWAVLLGLPRVSRHDDFFALGGHSLLAVQLSSRLRTGLGVEIPLAELFAHPTLAAFAARVASAEHSELAGIGRADRNEPLPLSFSQQRLWFLAQLDEQASVAYHMAGGVRLRGALDLAALQAALDRIVERHEVLRSSFESVQGTPWQVVHPARGFALLLADVTGASDPEAALQDLAHAEATAPFNLASGPLVRGRLVRLADEDHALLLTMHHVVSDGWSIGLLINELTVLYAAFRAGDGDPLPPLAVQYADYAAWQRQWLMGARQEAQLDFWRGTLAGAPAVLDLPTDRPRPAVQDFAGETALFELDAALSAKLKALGQRHGTTVFMTLLAAWAALLARLSGQSDLVIGTPVAGRTRTEVEPLIGFFINTLALRIDLSGTPSVAELLARVRASTLAAQAHQDLPFEQVIEAVQPVRSLAHNPLCQVMFSSDNTPEGSLDLPGVQLEALGSPVLAAHYDLALEMQESGGRIGGQLTYATSLFDRATIERTVAHYKTLLRALVVDEAGLVDDLPVASAAEHRQLQEWNATTAPHPAEGALHELFQAQARRTPDAIALVDEGVALTYAALDARANQLAHRLRAAGVVPGQYVVTVMARSAALVIAQLAIVKAGAAYVPLDLDVPAPRQALLAADCAAAAVLHAPHERPAWADMACLEVNAHVTPDPDEAAPLSVPVPTSAAAYVMYTSGSTGRPKGVVVPHRAVVNLVLEPSYARFAPDDRFAFASNPAFDSSTLEVWGALLNGACIVVVPQPTLLDPAALAAFVRSRGITVLILVAGVLRAYAPVLARQLPGVRTLITGGDVADAQAIGTLLREDAPQQLLQTYGPTETTQFVTTLLLRDVPADGRRIPIGRPMRNAYMYVLDTRGQPLPLGMPGELHIGGMGVAHGYVNHPQLTAERFVPDPFAAEPGARMYRTGDLGRWLPDGTVEFLGRADWQVKVRGFRIEPGEIEAALQSHPDVREAAVLAREDAPGDKRLVAYCTVDGDALDLSALRAYLLERLPEYMVPAAFVRLDAMPLTPNGKLDRRALPVPADDAFGARAYEPPQGDVETSLAALWSELLGIERVGRHDDFFELGGHSLLAVQLISRVHDRLGVAVPIAQLFAQSTLAQLAGHVHGGADTRPEPYMAVDRSQYFDDDDEDADD